MLTQPKSNQPAYLLAGVLFTVIALVALAALFMLRSKADVTTQEAQSGNTAPTVDSMYVAETSQGADIGPAGIGAGFTTNEGSAKTIYVGGTITDLNGCHNLMQATVTLYRSGVLPGVSCTPDTNNCYHVTLYPADFDGCDAPEDTDVIFETSFSLPNYVDPTDAGSPYVDDAWVAAVNVSDNAEEQMMLQESYEVNSLAAFSVPNAINYGSVALGADSSAIQLTFSNTGNRDVDSDVYAVDDMVSNQSGFDNIAASAVHYSLASGFTYGTNDTAVAKAPSTDLALALVQQTDDLTIPTTDTYWRLRLALSGIQGTYTNVVVFTAKAAGVIEPLSQKGSIDYSSSDGVNVSYVDTFSPMVYITAKDSATLMVVDYTDTANLVEVTSLSNTLANETSITGNGSYLILSSESVSNNFQIIDVTTPSTPSIVSTFTALSGGVKNVLINGNYAYVIGNTNQFAIVDITDPANPSVVAGSTITLDYPVVDIARVFDMAFVVTNDLTGHGYLYAIDASTPSTANIVGSGFQTYADAKLAAAFVNDKLTVYVVGNNTDFANSVQVVDASDPGTAMSSMGTYSINTNLVESVSLAASNLYISDNGQEVGSDNINVVNVSSPSSMTIAASTRLGAYNAAGTNYYIGRAAVEDLFISGNSDGIYYDLLPPAGGGHGIPVGLNGSVGKFAGK